MHDELTAWFEQHQRPLPWRETRDPYRIWISEVMLQQTQVETVLPYYERFVLEFPTVAALAAAEERRVLSLWAGLGYYSRARNLHTAAKLVVEHHGGVLPADYSALRDLPGIGEYTAGAILSIAYNRAYPAIDGNVRRILSRIHGWTSDEPRRLREAARRLVERAEPRVINQALMELGATVCSFRSPRCLVCPVQDRCAAFKLGRQEEIPPVKKRPPAVRVDLVAVVQSKGGRYLMREANGLWEFPMFDSLPKGTLTHAGHCRHTITHHRLEVAVYRGVLDETNGLAWQDVESVPMSSLTRKVLKIGFSCDCDVL